MKKIVFFGLLATFKSVIVFSQTPNTSSQKNNLIVPILLQKEERIAGNPLATYAAMLALEEKYKASPFKDIFQEQKMNMEEFLGFPNAGKHAMQLKSLKKNYKNEIDTLISAFTGIQALQVIKEEAIKTQIIIWGEEHHLSQTRALYIPMLVELWKSGFRYLAAEAFTKEVENANRRYPDYTCGYYIMDPVFADAVRVALHLGFKLVAYDSNEEERDKKQAENIKAKIFDVDPNAKVLIVAGRAHINEIVAPDGWEPMGYWLKKLTGIDPFTLFTPTMSERLTRNEEHPAYKAATQNMLIDDITIFKRIKDGEFYGTTSFDAYVFFPRAVLLHGRPDWMFSVLHRKPVNIPAKIVKKDSTLLIQAFAFNEPETAIPVDQLIWPSIGHTAKLALPAGKYRIRSIDKNGKEYGRKMVKVK